MTTQTVLEPAKKPNRSHWLLWWNIDAAELRQQVMDYDGPGWTKARHVAAYCFALSAAVSGLFAYYNIASFDAGAFLDVAAFVFLGACVFRGQRWAMIASMALWTYEKLYSIFDMTNGAHPSGSIIVPVIWWAIYMHAFWMAFRVEQERRKFDGLNLKRII
jgi:hypothetical protein